MKAKITNIVSLYDKKEECSKITCFAVGEQDGKNYRFDERNTGGIPIESFVKGQEIRIVQSFATKDGVNIAMAVELNEPAVTRSIPQKDRTEIEDYLISLFKERNSDELDMAMIAGKLNDMGYSYKKYGYEKCLSFLMEFDNIMTKKEVKLNNSTYYRFVRAKSDYHEPVSKLIKEVFDEHEAVELDIAIVAAKINHSPYLYKNYGYTKFSAFLEEFSDLVSIEPVDIDGNIQLKVKLLSGSSASVPAENADRITRKYVNKFCFCPASGNLLRQARELRGDETLSQAEWASRRTSALAQCLIGLNGGMLDDSKSDTPKMAFFTGMKTPLEQDIYGILSKNTNEGAIQDWICSALSFPGQDSEDGRWLCDAFGLDSQASYGEERTKTAAALSMALETVRRAQSELMAAYSDLQNAVDGGSAVPENAAAAVTEYINGWNEMKGILDSADAEFDEFPSSIDAVQKFLDDLNDANKVQEKFDQKFGELAQEVWTFMEDNMLCPENLADRDIALCKQLLRQNISDQMTERLKKLLHPYQAIMTLRSFDPLARGVLGDLEYTAMDAINEHFGSSLKPVQLKHSICNKDIDMDFLGLIPEIVSLINQLESKNKKPKMKMAVPDDEAILNAALNGEIWNIDNTAFGLPNAFEESVMLGDAGTVYELINDAAAMQALGYDSENIGVLCDNLQKLQLTSDVTPLHAAERLKSVIGISSRLIDRCLLLGMAQHEDGAAEALIKHYIDTNRYELAGKLFNISADNIPTESRRELMLTLLSFGYVSLTESIQRDVPALLTDEGISIVRSMQCDEHLQNTLTTLYENIKPTLVHHIVHLSPELQNYILRPENLSEAAKYFPELSENVVSDILRQNKYARGSTPLQVAERIYAFIGNWGDLAFQFAVLSENTAERQAFLFELYYDKNDDRKMLGFLSENPELRDEHFSYYIDLLFKNGEYARVCDAAGENRELSARGTMQVIISMLMCGQSISHLPEFDAASAVDDADILLELAAKLADNNKLLHTELLKRVFPSALKKLNAAELEQLVSANGAVSKDELYKTASEMTECCPELSIYCGNLLNITDFALLKASYLEDKFNMMKESGIEAQHGLARELQILDPEKYSELSEDFMQLRITELLERDELPAEKAQKLSELLSSNVIPPLVLDTLVEQLDEHEIIFCPPLYSQLFSMLENNEKTAVNCLRSAYRYKDNGDDEFRIFICKKCISFEKKGLLPDDFLIECEALLLQMPDVMRDADAYGCILHIEEKRGRKAFADFVRCMNAYYQPVDDNFAVKAEAAASELSLLCDVLESSDTDIHDYLAFCAAFVGTLGNGTENNPEKDNSDTESILHGLYLHSTDADAWDAFEKLIPQERVKAHAYALYYYALYLGKAADTDDMWWVEKSSTGSSNGKANSAWERCVLYCIAENQDALFFLAIQTWLRNINNYYKNTLPWYSMKPYMETLQNILVSSDPIFQGDRAQKIDFPYCPSETAAVLIIELIAVFKRIDQNKTNQISGDDNHNILRVIVELGLRMNCETILLEQLSTELMGSYVNLGLVLICRLLLSGKLSFVMPFLQSFANSSIREYSYPHLVKQLASMQTEEDLESWLSDEANRATLRFILPNGNSPDLLRLQTLVMSSYSGDAANREVCAAVIERLLDCYPRDVMCYKSLFIICKEEPGSNLARIHRALVGLFKFYTSRGYFTRTRDDIIALIVVLRHTMEAMGCTNPEWESVTELIRGYYQPGNNCSLDETVSRINQLSNEVKSLFVGIDSESDDFSLLIHSLLGAVTGNWQLFISEAFKRRIPNWIHTYRVDKYATWGLLRGLLRVWSSLPSAEEQAEFVKWAQSGIEPSGKKTAAERVLNHLYNLATKINADSVNWSMLRLPWEEHLVCLGNLKDINSPEKNCCYKLMMSERPKGASARDSFSIMMRLAQDNMKIQLLSGNARDWFRKGDYELAAAAYEALDVTNAYTILKFTGGYITPEIRNEYNEINETWMRISYVFAGMDLGSKNCSQHSCMNMMTALLNEGYAKYFDRLSTYFKGINLRLFIAVRKILSNNIGEEEMLDMVSEFRTDTERSALIAFLRFLLSKDRANNYLFLSDPDNIEGLTRRLTMLSEAQGAHKKDNYWIPLCVRPSASLFPSIDLKNLENESTEHANRVTAEINKSEGLVPFFISEAEKFCGEDISGLSMQELLNEYNKLSAYSDNDHSKRLKLSAQIYLLCIGNDDEKAGTEHAIVQFGINYYYYNRNRISTSENPEYEKSRVHKTMLDMAVYGLNTPKISTEVIDVIPIWFQYSIRGFSNIDSLLEDFSLNRVGYTAAAKLLSDTEYSNAANGLIEVLNSLLAAANKLGTKTADIRSYQTAQSRLSEVASTKEMNWTEMLAALNEMFRQAINKLDQRPSLKVTLFNEKNGLQNDGLYGEIENTGRASASHLEIQAAFPTNENQPLSALYQLSSLKPNEHAAFEISYRTSDDMEKLEYILDLSYNDNESRLTAEPIHGVLTLASNVKAPSVPQFNTHQASKFTVDENGEIVSRDFKGRKSEIKSLTDLLEGDDFSLYKSAIVQGIKRSGKSSLLNYLREYIRAKKSDNTIHVFCDCQGMTRPFIYKAFIKNVLDELPLEYPKVLSHPDWAGFVSRWRLQKDETDREPEELSLFYRQLHGMLDGKGLYVIIDEFDALLDGVGTETGHDVLLRSLRSLQQNPDCAKAVHMVICGSNNLLRYNRTGSALNQMFQSYEVIPVGQMLISDIEEMIMDLINSNPFIHFAEDSGSRISPSIQWIERYTGGLVWYTRLLVNGAIKAVIADNRDCIYPSDICRAFNGICNFDTCRQLIEGCGDDEKLVLDAMQTLSKRAGSYVSVDSLMQLLGQYLTAEQVKNALSVLTDTLALLEQKYQDVRSYRFRIELYRRYFRTADNHLPHMFNDPNVSDSQTGGDCFTINIASASNIRTVDSDSEFDSI